MSIRKQAAWIAAIPAVLAMFLVGASAAHAGETLVGEVPFEFTVGERTFPAGTYAFEVDRLSPGTVLIHSTGSSTSAIALARKADGARSSTAPAMKFNVYGDQRFISLIRTSKGTVVSLGQGTEERTLARTGVELTVAFVHPTTTWHTRF